MISGGAFREAYVETDGFRIRYREAGRGEPLVCLHGAGGMRVSRSHELLAEQYRMIVFEVPGFGQSPANERSDSIQDLADTMAQAAANLGLERFNLMGNSFGGRLALPELEDRLADLNVPVLVLFGTLDRVIPPEAGRIYREKLPNCHFILVYDAGHAVDADRPEAFASVVVDFLQRGEGFLVRRESGLINP